MLYELCKFCENRARDTPLQLGCQISPQSVQRVAPVGRKTSKSASE